MSSDPFLDSAGRWSYLQLVDANDDYYHWNLDGTTDRIGWSLGGGFTLDGTRFPYASGSISILDGSTGSLASNPTSTGATQYALADNADTPLAFDTHDVEKLDEKVFEVIRNDKYELYIMYQPPGTKSQWVPLKVMTWNMAFDIKDPSKDGKWTTGVSKTEPNGTPWVAPSGPVEWAYRYLTGHDQLGGSQTSNGG